MVEYYAGIFNIAALQSANLGNHPEHPEPTAHKTVS